MNRQRVPAWLALGLPASAVLFNVAWLVLGFISPGFTIWGTEIAPYSPISAGISGLGLGLTAPYMNAAFIVSGLLVFAGVAGSVWNIPELSARDRWLCFCLLGVLPAVGLVTDGVFTLESMMFHLAGFAVGVGGSVPGFLVVGVYPAPGTRVARAGKWAVSSCPAHVGPDGPVPGYLLADGRRGEARHLGPGRAWARGRALRVARSGRLECLPVA